MGARYDVPYRYISRRFRKKRARNHIPPRSAPEKVWIKRREDGTTYRVNKDGSEWTGNDQEGESGQLPST